MFRAIVFFGLLLAAAAFSLTAFALPLPGPGPGFAAPDGASRLKWAPPALSRPTTFNIPAGSGNYRVPILPGTDAIVTCTHAPRNGTIFINSGRNVVMMGCNLGDGRLAIRGTTGVVHIEGVSIFRTSAKNDDGITIGNPGVSTNTVRLQNIYVAGIHGSRNTNHADIVQITGDVNLLQIYRFTGDTNYQGFFMPPQHAIGRVEVFLANLSHNTIPLADGNPASLFWWNDGDTANRRSETPYPVTCESCYARVRADQSFSAKGYYPRAGVTIGGVDVSPYSDDGGRSVCWPASLRFSSRRQANGACSGVISGDPPGGNFVPSNISAHYVSPGYRL